MYLGMCFASYRLNTVKKMKFFIVISVFFVFSSMLAENKVYVLNPENDFPIFTQGQIDTLNRQICIDVENALKPDTIIGIYNYRIYTLCLRNKYGGYGLMSMIIPSEYKPPVKKIISDSIGCVVFDVQATALYNWEYKRRRFRRKWYIDGQRMVAAVTVVLDSCKRFLGRYSVQGFIPKDYEAISYAISKREELGIRWYFMTDIGDKYVIGIAYDNSIYAFYDDDGIFTTVAFDDFPESRICEHCFDKNTEYPLADMKDGIERTIVELLRDE